jgi:hypothetical protein
VAHTFEHSNEPSYSREIEEFLDQLSDCQHLKEDAKPSAALQMFNHCVYDLHVRSLSETLLAELNTAFFFKN